MNGGDRAGPADEAIDGDSASGRWPIRIWPGLLILGAAAILAIVPGIVVPRTMVHFISAFGAPAFGAVAIIGWWTFAAGVRGRARWLFPVLLLVPAVAFAVTLFRTAPMAVGMYALPLVATVWILWLAATPMLAGGVRRAGLVVAMLGAWAAFGCLAFDGVHGDLLPAFRWRWQPTAEERFLADRAARPAGAAVESREVSVGPGDWAGFRGAARDGRVTGVSIDPDWSKNPPSLVWKHLVGPGWGSFAVVGDRLFTQEQRGPNEAVVCYAASTGSELWEHLEPARFEEVMGGAGPRATPTIHDGRLYSQGATGRLLCLNAADGTMRWAADLTGEAGGVMPQWGFAGSPLVIDGLVVVYAGGPNGRGTAAFRADTGALAWTAGKARHSYSSPHPATLGGTAQVLIASDYGLESFRPADGRTLWENDWYQKGMNRVTQPTVIDSSDVVFGTGVGNEQGLRRLHVASIGDRWECRSLWTSKAMKGYYNDAVVYGGHIYGFDGDRFCCVDLETGAEKWKEGAYGHGQVLLLADQGLLLVQAVDGKVALVEANPRELVELGKFSALTGKTWNHPVVAHGHLFVRNGQEAACYRLK